jgi:uncharacterized protein (DUF983 family)
MPTALDTPPEVLAQWHAKLILLRNQVRAELVHYADVLCPMCLGYGTFPLFLGHHDRCTECGGDGSRTR